MRKCVVKAVIVEALKNVADEMKKTGGITKKVRKDLNRAGCRKADRVFRANKCTEKCKRPGIQLFNKNLNRCLLKHSLHKEANIVVKESHLNEACSAGMQFNSKTKKCEKEGPINETQCTTKSRSWIWGECSTQCRSKGSLFDKKSGTCLSQDRPIATKCSEGFFWHETLARCIPYFIDLVRTDCIEAGLYWLPANLKKGRTRNGCYLRCKNKAFVYNKANSVCQVAVRDKWTKKECKNANRRYSNTRQICTGNCRSSRKYTYRFVVETKRCERNGVVDNKPRKRTKEDTIRLCKKA